MILSFLLFTGLLLIGFLFPQRVNNLFYISAFVLIVLWNAHYLYLPVRRLETLIATNQKSGERMEEDAAPHGGSLDEEVEQILLRQKQTLDREHKAELLRKETELSTLINQINPHFLYNTLDSMRGYAVLHNMGEIADLTKSLSSLFRNVITGSREYVSLKDELNNISCYMRIQSFRFNNKVSLVQDIEDPDVLNYTVLNLTLQPIVENAVFYGLENKVGKGQVTVVAYRTEKRLVLTVSDNGIGMEQEKVDELNRAFVSGRMLKSSSRSRHTGIALVNINKRIQLHFGGDYGLKITSTPGVGTDVEIVLPVLSLDPDEKDGRMEKGQEE